RALRGLIHGCTPTPPGRTLMLLKQVRSLEVKAAALEKQVGRYQALLRNAQRSAGLLPPPTPSPSVPGKTTGRRKHRPVVRAMRAIAVLQRAPAGGEEPVESQASSLPASALVVT